MLLGSVAWLVIARRAASSTSPPLRLLTVTTFPGAEGMPSLSPDGNFVAFNWTGPVFSDTADVWVKAVDGDALRRLTDTPQFHEALPSWSPDGRLDRLPTCGRDREPRGLPGVAVWRTRAEGRGQGRGPILDTRQSGPGHEGRTAAGLPAIFEHALDTGERRQLTSPPPGFVDQFPKVSPDGATLAFVRMSESQYSQAAVFVVPMANKEGRENRPVSPIGPSMSGGWTGRRTAARFSTRETNQAARECFGSPSRVDNRRRRYRGSPSGSTCSRYRGCGETGTFGSRSHMGKWTWAFGLSICAPRPQGVRLPAGSRSATRRAWTCPDASLATAPDMAFTSDRDGSPEVLAGRTHGAGLRRVPGLQSLGVNVGSWSPDGRSVALDAVVGSASDIYIVGVDGGPHRRLTDGRAHASDPDWSSDGRWIYYASDASGRSRSGRFGVDDGKADPDHDRRWLRAPRSALTDGVSSTLSPLTGTAWPGFHAEAGFRRRRPPSVALSGVPPGAWDVTDTGIVFLSGHPVRRKVHRRPTPFEFYSFADGRVRRMGTLPFMVARFGASRLLVGLARWPLGARQPHRQLAARHRRCRRRPLTQVSRPVEMQNTRMRSFYITQFAAALAASIASIAAVQPAAGRRSPLHRHAPGRG